MKNRILVLAPFGRDAQVITDVLRVGNVHTYVCHDGSELLRQLRHDSAATFVTEEMLGAELNNELRSFLAAQPPWSDYPFVVLAARQTMRRTERARLVLQDLSNVVLIERPVNPDTLVSAAQSAIRARQRQYLTREHLGELERAKMSVDRLNAELETRIAERTVDLASANDRLMREMVERERVENSRVQSQKMEALGRLTGGIAHDFNNLLHVVNLNLQLIERSKIKDDKVRGFARQAKQAVSRGSRLTSQLLSFARTQSLVPRLHEINELIRNMAELISTSIGGTVKLSLDLCLDPIHVTVDVAQMEMAILNLAVNSRDAMPRGGHITIRTVVSPPEVPKPSEVVLEISDTGSGIAPNLLGKVFDPFFTTKQHGGTGLGLSQVYGFTRQSGGRAEVESQLGRGTTVRLFFPMAEPPSKAGSMEPLLASINHSGHAAEVLVVEDDPDVRQSMVECLQVLGFSVREAANGAQGLDQLRTAKPDLLLVDYLMPEMNGAELIQHAREIYRHIPILMATGYADMEAVERLIGPQSVLAKPFDLETLGKAVSSELQRTRFGATEPS